MTAKAVRLPVKKSVILEVVVALKVAALMEVVMAVAAEEVNVRETVSVFVHQRKRRRPGRSAAVAMTAALIDRLGSRDGGGWEST
jgi:hypothetical protein